MEPGEEPRNKVAAVNEESEKAAGGARVSLSAIVVAIVIALALFGWLLAR